MARRRKRSMFSIRKPRLTIGKRGMRISPPSLRLGGRGSGLNISKSGVSVSSRTRHGTFNSKRGCSRTLGALLLPVIGVAGFALWWLVRA